MLNFPLSSCYQLIVYAIVLTKNSYKRMNLSHTSDDLCNVDVGRIMEETNEHEEDWQVDKLRWIKIFPFWDRWGIIYTYIWIRRSVVIWRIRWVM
jgi:hypothetical protein